MKKLAIFLMAGSALLASCKKTAMEAPTSNDGIKTIGANPKAAFLQQLLSKYTAKGIPGAVIAIKDANGLWMGAEGYAKLEDKTPMSPHMAQYGYSITKIITATSIMQLKEAGKIELDRPIKTYLPSDLQNILPQTDVITVRMLLSHTSGYSDITRVESYRLKWLDNPLRIFKREEYYHLLRKKLQVENTPGTIYSYSNTNYYLLSIIIDQVTGKPHGEWFQQHIFNKLDLEHTYYKQMAGYPQSANTPNTYMPRFGTPVMENNTQMQQVYMRNEIYGEDGLIATPENYIRILEALVEGQLVSQASLNEMKQWVQNPGSSEPDYGLGLSYWGYGNKPNFGHSGGGIGGTSLCLYFPNSQTYLFFAVNTTQEFGGISGEISMFMNDIGNYLAGF